MTNKKGETERLIKGRKDPNWEISPKVGKRPTTQREHNSAKETKANTETVTKSYFKNVPRQENNNINI